jgi:hypothetical protein
LWQVTQSAFSGNFSLGLAKTPLAVKAIFSSSRGLALRQIVDHKLMGPFHDLVWVWPATVFLLEVTEPSSVGLWHTFGSLPRSGCGRSGSTLMPMAFHSLASSFRTERQAADLNPHLKTPVRRSVQIEVLGFLHGGEEFRGVQHVGYAIRVGPWTVLHVGDAEMSESNFKTFGLVRERIDVALLPFWFLLAPEGQNLVKKHIQPKRTIAIHVPDTSASELSEASRKIKMAFPNRRFSLRKWKM